MKDECFNIIEIASRKFKENFKKNDGFAGYTHALSGVAVVLLLLGFLPDFTRSFGVAHVSTMVAFAFAFVGATLVPDLDNTSSRAKSSLGFLGVIISTVFRVSSQLIQTVVRTPKDDSSPNPHRGFYHTALSSLLLGGLVWGLSSIPHKMTAEPLAGKTVGDIFAAFFLFILVHLCISALAHTSLKKAKSKFVAGEVVAIVFSLAVALSMFFLLPADGNYLWLAVAMALGCIVHILGDGFTKYGVPIFFPLTVFTKGRFWWYTRFAKLTSGGELEKVILPVAFSILGLVGLVKIIMNFMN